MSKLQCLEKMYYLIIHEQAPIQFFYKIKFLEMIS